MLLLCAMFREVVHVKSLFLKLVDVMVNSKMCIRDSLEALQELLEEAPTAVVSPLEEPPAVTTPLTLSLIHI